MTRGRPPYFTPDQDADIERLYRTGLTLQQIADQFGVSHIPVTAALDRRGVKRKTGKRTAWTGSPEQKRQVLDAYAAGTAVREIARTMGTRTTQIAQVVEESDVRRRRSGNGNRVFTDVESEAIADEYRQGASIATIAQAHQSNSGTVRNTLRRIGVETRGLGRAEFWTADRVTWLRDQYAAGRSASDIGRELGLTGEAISGRLRRMGLVGPPERRRGADHPGWKGGRTVNDGGYVMVRPTPDDAPYLDSGAAQYVPEHRLVMARALGRPLTETETVHHIRPGEESKRDNRLENLQLRQGQHGTGVVARCRLCHSHDIEFVPLAGAETLPSSGS